MIGAAFVIGLQMGAILSYGSLSRIGFLQSEASLAHAPDLGSIAYWPALAVLGDMPALAGVIAASLLLLGLSIVLFSPRFGDHAIAAAGVSPPSRGSVAGPRAFAPRTRRGHCGARSGRCSRAILG